jgi:hypothetical protein
MAEIDPNALGFELAIGFGLGIQVAILLLIAVLLVVARSRGPNRLVRLSVAVAVVVTPIAYGFVCYHCLRFRDYVRSKADDPIATTKLAADRASIPPAAIAGTVLCVVSFAIIRSVARFSAVQPSRNEL